MKYIDRQTQKVYEVDEVPAVYKGAIVNVNGTTITDCGLMSRTIHNNSDNEGTYSVFVEGDEVLFNSFEEAYNCAVYRQKDTGWL